MNKNNQHSVFFQSPQAWLGSIFLALCVLLQPACGKDTLSEIPPALHVPYVIVDFGDVAIGGDGVVETLSLKNVGGQVLDVGAAMADGGVALGFGYTTPESAIALKSQETFDLDLTFNPAGQGSVEATLLLTTNDPQNATLQVRLIGNGISANLCASPDEALDFGEVQQNAELVRSVVVENCGSAQLCISSVGLTGTEGAEPSSVFALVDAPSEEVCLEPGESITVNVTFSPAAEEAYTGNLEFKSNNLDGDVNVALSGLGAPPPVCLEFNPSSLTMGTLEEPVYVGGSTTNNKTLGSNCGDDPLHLTFYQITGPGASAFEAAFAVPGDAEATLPYELAVLDSETGEPNIEFNVTFTPPDSGLHTATLEVYHCNDCGTEQEEQIVVGSVLLQGYAASLCEPTPECCGPDCVTEWEIVRNGDFSQTDTVTADWANCEGEVLYPSQWNVRVDEPYNDNEPLACSGAPGGIDHHWVEVVDSELEEYGNVLKIKKDKGGGGGSWDIATQTLNLDVSKCGSLVFSLDGKATNQSLAGAGHTQGEWPVIMRVAYQDANGVDHRRFHLPNVYGWQHGLYYYGEPGYLSEPQIQAGPISTLIAEDTWYSDDTVNNPNPGEPFDSGNLMALLDPPPKVIYWIGVGGAGWDYTSEIDNVSMLGSQPICE
ncbi:MAG: choice-of-anchor D domain-containing protein [Myxococcota bacterium]|nr:choice-of-anchor D domain-containing protein [Myxococcota bacterium]